ncbi:MAG: VWA domain-containing protein [Planctomycetota bacterium]
MRQLALAALIPGMVALGCSRAGNDARDWAPAAGQIAYEIEPAVLPLEGERLSEVEFNTEAYDRIYENPFLLARQNPLSTFSIDVDTASYTNVRRFLNQGDLPPKDAVRIEELVNYFTYDYPQPEGESPFSAHVEVAACPWNPNHRLARIGLKGMEVPEEQRGPCNLVFLLDVSGSMRDANKLPLLKSAMKMLVEHLCDRDRVAIAVYAGASGLILPSTSCEEKGTILSALDRLEAGGSTNGGEGIQLAYSVAEDHFDAQGINRVILCTDGDFNVGMTNQGDLVRMIEQKASGGVFLTVLGFGMGNYKDSTLEKLADKGNGNYGYIDTLQEARKVLVEEMGGTLVTIAKDVKIQVDFNPTRVGAYRLIGYENRMLRAEDFHDDTKDAGEIGSGHTVTALYELIAAGQEGELPKVDASKYQQPVASSEAAQTDEIFTLKLRYKQPDSDTSQLLTFPVLDPGTTLADASGDFHFATAVACFGMVLRESEHRGTSTLDLALELAQAGKGQDPGGYRSEFVQLIGLAKSLSGR